MDIGKATKAVMSISPESLDAETVNGGGVDTKGFHEALVVLDCGVTTATGTLDVKVQESADNSTFADIAGATFTQVTPANDVAIYQGRIRMTPTRKRYLRAVAVAAVAASIAGVSFILGEANNEPAATPEFDIHG